MKQIALLVLIAAGLDAGTIVIYQGTTPGSDGQPMVGPSEFGGEYVDVGWTTGNSAYSGVEIDATLQGNDSLGDAVDAWLTTSVGSSTTSAYATTTDIDVSYSASTFSSVALFSGLDLAANTTYYLTIAPEGSDGVTWGIDDAQPRPVTDAGVSLVAATYCASPNVACADFAPASPSFDPGSYAYSPADATPIFSVTAQEESLPPTPEPATAPLLAVGLTFVAIVSRSRWRT